MKLTSYQLRMKLIELLRRDKGKLEEGKNSGAWIKKLWTATSYGLEGYSNREPYCAAGLAYNFKDWVSIPEVAEALGMTPAQAEEWRCKSASAFRDTRSWLNWAKSAGRGVQVLPWDAIYHTGDIVIYDYSHIEVVVTDDGNTSRSGGFTAIGYNTGASGSRDGEGWAEKPRTRSRVGLVIRILP